MTDRRQSADALLPLRPVVFQVLISLSAGEKHGYAVVQDIGRRPAARLRLEPGNLYRSLKWMLDQGLIDESERRPSPDLDDERRRYYRITRFGQRVAQAETTRLQQVVSEARRKLGKT